MSPLIAHLWFLLGRRAAQHSAKADPFEFIVDANDPQTRYKVVVVSQWLSVAHLGKVISQSFLRRATRQRTPAGTLKRIVWSANEDNALLAGLERFGKGNWKDIKHFAYDTLLRRSPTDIRDRCRTLAGPTATFSTVFLAFLHSSDLPLETSVTFTPKTPVNSEI